MELLRIVTGCIVIFQSSQWILVVCLEEPFQLLCGLSASIIMVEADDEPLVAVRGMLLRQVTGQGLQVRDAIQGDAFYPIHGTGHGILNPLADVDILVPVMLHPLCDEAEVRSPQCPFCVTPVKALLYCHVPLCVHVELV